MVPVSDEEAVAPVKGGATSFFAMPQARRKDPAAPDEPSGLKRSDPLAVSSAPTGAPPSAPMGGYVPMGAVPPSPMMMPVGISGPVAGAPYGMPVPAAMPQDSAADVQRARSYRVFAVVIALTGMVFAVMVAAVILIFSVVMLRPVEGTDGGGSPTVGVIAPPPPAPTPAVDTGVVAPVIKDKKKTPSPVPKEGGGTPRPVQPAPPPPTKTAPISVTLAPDAPMFTSMEIVCETGGERYRKRTDFVNGTSTQADVPRGDCTLYFKGGTPANVKVSGGQTLTCSFIGAQPNCK